MTMVVTPHLATSARTPGASLESITVSNSFRYVLARWITDLPGIAVGLVGSLTWIAAWPAPWGPLVQGLLLLWVASLVVGPLIRWRTVTYHLSAEGIRVDSGVLSRRRESLPWDLVASTDHRQPWVYQRLGITEIVCAQTGEDGSRVRLDGITEEDDATFRRHATLAGTAEGPAMAVQDEPTPEEPPREPAPVSDRAPADSVAGSDIVLHRTSVTDLLVLGLVYGQVLLLVPPLAFGLMEITDALGLTRRLENALLTGMGSWPTALIVVMAALMAGLAATVLKYHDFTVVSQADGRLRISYGLFSTHERTITPDAVQGVVWHRNGVEQLFGRARLSVLTLDSTAQLGGNLILPSMPLKRARPIVAEHLPDFSGVDRRLSTGPGAGLVNLATLVVIGALLSGTWILTARTWHWHWSLAAAVCIAASGIALRLVALLTARITADPEQHLFVTRGITIAEKVTAVRSTRLHALTTRHLQHRGTPSRRGKAWLPTAHWFAGSPRRSTALTAPAHTVEHLQHMVRCHSTPLRS